MTRDKVDQGYSDLGTNPGQGPGAPNLQPDVTSTKEKVRTVTLAWKWAHVFGLIKDDPTMVLFLQEMVQRNQVDA